MITESGQDLEVRIVDRTTGTHIINCTEAQVQSVSDVLNSYGQMSFIHSTTSQGADWASKLHEVEVQLWVDGHIYWWGIPMTEGGGPGEQTVGCDGLFAYFEERIIDDQSVEWLSVEQFFIARDLVLYAQNEASGQLNRDLRIGVQIPAPSGKVRTQRYVRAEHQIIAELLREFPTLTDGFDFEIGFTDDGQRFFKPYYPRKGDVISDVMLEFGKNITSYGFSRSAVDMRTQTYATGGAVPNTQEGRMEAVYEDTVRSAQTGVIQHVISEGSQMDPDWLAEKAQQDVEQNRHPSGVPDITAVSLEDSQLFGQIKTGDYVPVRILDGYRTIEDYFRVGTITWSPAEDTISYSFISQGLPA